MASNAGAQVTNPRAACCQASTGLRTNTADSVRASPTQSGSH